MVCKYKVKTIAISQENYEKFRRYGHTPETFDEVMTRLLAKVEAQEKRREESKE